MSNQKVTPAIYLYLEKDGKILLGRRFNTGFEDGKYTLPAGHADHGESLTKSLIREMKEEISLKLRLEDLKFVHLIHKTADEERFDIFFKASKWEGKLQNLEPDECDDLSWFPVDKLPKNTIAYISHAIDYIKKRMTYSEFGWGR